MNASSGAVEGGPRLILRSEGAALAIGAAFFYGRLDGPWLLFLVLFFAPDLSFLAYLVSPRIGAIVYNAMHSTIGPLALFALAGWAGVNGAKSIALIWLAHVGFDRALGYGLKYAIAFNATHLGRIGRASGAL